MFISNCLLVFVLISMKILYSGTFEQSFMLSLVSKLYEILTKHPALKSPAKTHACSQGPIELRSLGLPLGQQLTRLQFLDSQLSIGPMWDHYCPKNRGPNRHHRRFGHLELRCLPKKELNLYFLIQELLS